MTQNINAENPQATEVQGVHTGNQRVAIPGMDLEGEKLAPELATEESFAPKTARGNRGQTEVMGSRAERPWSFEVETFPVPRGKEEEWRFTPVKRLAPVFQDAPAEEGSLEVSVEAPDSWTVGALALGQEPRNSVLRPADRPAAIAAARTESALYLQVPEDQEREEPVYVRVHGTGEGRRSVSHIVLEAGARSRSTVVLDHTGSGIHNGNLEVILREGAKLTVVSLQQWEQDAVHTGQHDAEVGQAASYRHINVTLGGSIVRLNANVRYSGEGADAQMYGLYYADSRQHLEHRSFVDHNSPRNKSNVLYKGALQGEDAHTVWVGDVLIQKAAEGTDSYEKNQNLVLNDGCRADSVPNLEIETGIIEGAGHASTTGQLDDEHLWYLMARGIPEKQARRLVVRGFLNEIIQQIRVPEIEEALMASLEEELAVSNN